MNSRDEDLVTIASFRDYVQANIAKTKLESEGVDCWIADDVVVTLNWFESQLLGGVKLRVRESESREARAALGEPMGVSGVPRVTKVIFILILVLVYIFPLGEVSYEYLRAALTGAGF